MTLAVALWAGSRERNDRPLAALAPALSASRCRRSGEKACRRLRALVFDRFVDLISHGSSPRRPVVILCVVAAVELLVEALGVERVGGPCDAGDDAGDD